MTSAPVPTLVEETCRPCGGVGCVTCGWCGRWLRSPYDVRVSGELREDELLRVDVELYLHWLETGRPIDVRDGYEMLPVLDRATPLERALLDACETFPRPELLEAGHG